MHTHAIYIYIFTNLISTSIHGTEKKTKKKNPGQEQKKKSISNHRPGEKGKILGQKKEKANLVRPLEKNQGIRSQWSKENQKTLRESCNATITKVLKTRQCSQL